MDTYAGRTQNNKTASDSTSKSQGTGKSSLQFVDNRPETISQRKAQEIASNSAQVAQLETHQTSADKVAQCMSWQESKSLVSSDYQDPVSDGVSGGGVWMYVLKHVSDTNYDIRVHYHAGSSKGSKAWTVRWNNEGSGNNIATQKWMRDRVNTFYQAQQT